MKNIYRFIKRNTIDRLLNFINTILFFVKTRKSVLKITIGASNISQDGWISSEKDYLNLLKEDHWKKYFKEGSIDILLAEHVWEHLTNKEALLASRICYKYLKKGGHLRIAVPDGLFPNKIYINNVKPNGIGPGADDHKVLYTYITVKHLFEKTGFEVKMLEYFDENGKFHSNRWQKENGMIFRSKRYDERNSKTKLVYTSIILDAVKK